MKKIFIVAPHFPPSSLPPAQRVRLMVKHLEDLGWSPTIFTVEHRFREELEDKWMVELAGDKYNLITIPCIDQKKSRKFGIGDLGLRLLPFLSGRLIRWAKKEKPDFILYPVPPWYIMVIAPWVKFRTRIPYGIDFIDPWVRKKSSKDNFKAKLSQWIARRLEGFSVRRASLLFAVSEGIISDLRERYPDIRETPSVAVPYGVEIDDYSAVRDLYKPTSAENLTVRYIGALSDGMLSVVKVLLRAFKDQNRKDVQIEFIGTNYAGAGLAKSKVEILIEELEMHGIIKEYPERVSYKEALRLTAIADLLIIVGDLTPYYAASKLMGMIASQKPFIAFLHRLSFPAKFLEEVDYKYVVRYGNSPGDLPEDHLEELTEMIGNLFNSLGEYKPVSMLNPIYQHHTAREMTKIFTNAIEQVII